MNTSEINSLITWRFPQMTESCTQFAISDKVRDIDNLTEWWVLTLYPDLNSVVCITTDESRSTRKTFKPHQLVKLPYLAVFSV